MRTADMIDFVDAAIETIANDTGWQTKLDDGTTVRAWVDPDEPECRAIRLQHLWPDSTLISEDQVGFHQFDASELEDFWHASDQGIYS